MCFAPQRQRALFQPLNLQKWSERSVFCTFWLGNVLRATTPCTFWTSQLPKVFLATHIWHFWLGNVLRATMADGIFSTSQFPKLFRPVSFWNFALEMCFATQRRALFRHLNFQEWSETVSFWHFWLGKALRATTVCTFSTSQLLKVFRPVRFLSLLTWKCASRHNGVQFFISYLAGWLRTCRFREPTFRPS